MNLIKIYLAFSILILGGILNTYCAARITEEVEQEENTEQENEEYTPEDKKQQIELLEAAKSGDLEKVKKLVANGVNINCENREIDYEKSDSSLYSSDSHLCSIEVYRCLSSDNNFTPLMLASKYGHIKVVEYLLTIPDIEINTQLADIAEEGTTIFDAAHIAAFYKQNEIFKLIISHPKYHPSRDILCSMIHVQKLLALKKRIDHLKKIIASKFLNTISTLILDYMDEMTGDIPTQERTPVNYYTQLAIDNLKEKINLPSPAESYTDYTEGLPLLCAVANRCDELDFEVAKLLLKNRFINVNNKRDDITPLGTIAYRGSNSEEFNISGRQEFIVKMVKLLTAHKDINLNALSKDNDGKLFSPLIMAYKQIPADFGQCNEPLTNMVKYMLNFLNLSSKSVSLLDKLAIKNKDIETQELVKKFFERKKLVPLLFNTIKSGDERTVRALIKKCPLKIYDDKTKDNPLHLAVEYGNANIIKLIFSVAPYLADLPNKDNLTPIDLVVTQPESLAIFFSKPIDPTRCLYTTATKESSLIKSSLISSSSSSSSKIDNNKIDVISALLKANLDYENSTIGLSSKSKEDNDSDDSDDEKEIQQAQKKSRI